MKIKKYAVHHQSRDNAEISIYFCLANNETHAENKCELTHPESDILDVVEANDSPDDLFVEEQ